MSNQISDAEIESILDKFDSDNQSVGKGLVVGKQAPDFTLQDQAGTAIKLSDGFRNGPTLLAFFPSSFSSTSMDQICNYRDAIESFKKLKTHIYAISPNSAEYHAALLKENDLPFSFLTDKGNRVATAFGGSALSMRGQISRGVYVINTRGTILHAHTEPVMLTHQNTDKLIALITSLRDHKLL